MRAFREVPPQHHREAPNRHDLLARLAAGAAFALYAALQLYSLFPYESDANIYMYLASRASEGALPYADFFHAHPPLHLLPAILTFRITGGFDLVAVRVISMGAAIVAGMFLYRAGRRLGPAEAALSSALYLLSYHALVLSGHFLGSSLSAMWIAIALERIAAKRPGQGGTAFALATFTLLSAAPVGIAVGAALLIQDRAAALRYAFSGLAAFALLNLLAGLAYGGSFFDQVYLYHTGKATFAGASLAYIREFAYTDPWIVYAALAGITAMVLRAGDATATEDSSALSTIDSIRVAVTSVPLLLLSSALGAIAFLIFLATLPRVFTHYFLAVIVCAAPLASFGVADIARRARSAIKERSPGRLAEAAILLGICCLGLLPFALGNTRESVGTATYTWRDSGVPWVDAWVRPLFWRDEKLAQTWYGPITRHLWIASGHFDAATALAREVRTRSDPGDSLFGDSTSAPLVALLADRHISMDEADTNAMRWKRDGDPLGKLLARLDTDPPRFIIGRWRWEIFGFRSFRDWVERNYHVVFEVEEPRVRATYQLWQRNDAPPE